jgi:molybdopterin-guanine dinucleotide biosynthesis protein A
MNETSSLWPHPGALLLSGCDASTSASPGAKRMWNDNTMLKEVLRSMLRVCRSVVVVGEDPGVQLPHDERIRRLANPHKDPDALTSLETLLGSNLDSGYLVAACNQPFLTIPLLRQLTEGNLSLPHLFLVPKGISFHPFPGYYPAALHQAVKEMLNSECPSLRSLFKQNPPLWIPLSETEENHLLCINSPSHFEKLQRLAGQNNISF